MSRSAEHWMAAVKGKVPQGQAVELGPVASQVYRSDPRMLLFILSRYKWVARMMEPAAEVIEIGCGDGLGAPLVRQALSRILVATDVDHEQLKDNRQRLPWADIEWMVWDPAEQLWGRRVDAIYGVDVLEHIMPQEEEQWMCNVCGSLREHGVLLLGTPNAEAQRWASEHSRSGHVNLKTVQQLKEIGRQYFHQVLMWGQNDEVVHTGFAPMQHYLWMMGIGPRERPQPPLVKEHNYNFGWEEAVALGGWGLC